MNLDDALHTFIEEARDLLQQMEDALLGLEQTPADADTLNAIFRAAHTIKGSAGLFGLDHIVAFTHVAENVLDRVRNGELDMTPELVALFLETGDHIGVLIDHLATAGGAPDAAIEARGQELVARLNACLGVTPVAVPQAGVAVTHERPYAAETDGGGSDHWHISLRFGRDVLRYGMDPIACLRYLETLGHIERIVTLTEPVPVLTSIDPETCYLGFEISFKSEADKAAIEGAFDFVRELSLIRILPPHSRMSEYLGAIRDLPEDDMLLGDILVRCGTLTQGELDAALRVQSSQSEHAPGTATQPLGQMLVEQSVVQPKVVEAALEKQKQIKEHKAAENNSIRVDARRLDQLINLVGELIITGAGANLAAQRLNDGDLLEITATMGRLVEEVRDSALNLRMVQIGATFNRFQRVVHDMSRDLDKDIRLVISGEDTELDKTVVEKIGDPLTHLVRNSMDHGIESAEQRVAAGKPAHGTLKLNAYHDSGAIVIEVADDGGGLKKERILAKAIERGLIAADANLADKDIYNLIFEPGFSTVEKVSNLSGRGVGMDVVRRNIQALRGTVELDSREGEGTTVRIHLPLTLAIIDGFLVGVGDASYVLPLDMVIECIELRRRRTAEEDDDFEADAEESDDADVQYDDMLDGEASHYLNLRGEVLPFLRLREVLDVEGPPSERQSVVVVQFGGRKAGLVVDHLVGETQTVIKPLGKVFNKIKGVGGFTIMGNGAVALIIDVPGLMQRFASHEPLALAA